MNPKIVEFHVDKHAKMTRTARGKRKNDTSSTVIPKENPHCFEIESGGDDYLELWVETDKPDNVYIKVDTANETGKERVRAKIKKAGNTWKLMAFFEPPQHHRPQGVNVTIGEDETEG